MIAHMAGAPLEEILLSASGPVAALALARTWLTFHLRRRREPDDEGKCLAIVPAEHGDDSHRRRR